MNDEIKVILASASPRRKELLSQIGISFSVVVSNAEEIITKSNPGEVVEELSAQKAKAVAEGLSNQEKHYVVIGADTVVACGGTILGKPKNSEQAVEMLKGLQGKKHQVYTGVTLLLYKEDKVFERIFHECTEVKFYPMTVEEIQEYVQTGDPLDKAGAYGIQGFCARYIQGIEGDYNNVVGLPVARLYHELQELLKEV